MNDMTRVPWDGKNLAVVQRLLSGWPTVQVDKAWNLTVAGLPVPVGSMIGLSETGMITVEEP